MMPRAGADDATLDGDRAATNTEGGHGLARCRRPRVQRPDRRPRSASTPQSRFRQGLAGRIQAPTLKLGVGDVKRRTPQQVAAAVEGDEPNRLSQR